MKLVFVGGLLDFINKPLCDEFYKLLGNDFKFIALTNKTELRKDYMFDFNAQTEYLVKGYEKQNEIIVQELIEKSDVVMFSSTFESLLKKRLLSNKITFRVTERLYKEPFTCRNYLRRLVSIFIHHKIYQKESNFVLCNGAYVPEDFKRFNCYKNKMFRWGYFTQTSSKTFEQLNEIKKKEVVEILWAGRVVALKHPETAIYLAEALKKENKKFHITVVGDGEELSSIKKLADEKEVADLITFAGAKSHDEVVDYMEKSDIYLFSSDRREGWGAVVLEAMGSACVTFASSDAGSTNSVINDGENGFTYTINDRKKLIEKVLFLLDNPQKIDEISNKAYKTINEEWNHKEAAKRFVGLINSMLNNEKITEYSNGPIRLEK